MSEQTNDPLRLLGLKEIAAVLGTDWRNVRELVEAGDLPCVRIGASAEPRVARATLEAWLRRLGEAAADRLSNPLSNRPTGVAPRSLPLPPKRLSANGRKGSA